MSTRTTLAITAGGLAIVGSVFFLRWHTVPSGNVALVSSFGVIQEKVWEPGLHIHPAWVKYLDFPIGYVPIEFTQSTSQEGYDPDLTSVTYTSADGYRHDMSFVVKWAPVIENIPYFKSRQSEESAYTKLIIDVARTAARDVGSKLRLDDGSMQNREAIETKLAAAIQNRTMREFQTRGYGGKSNQIVNYGLVSVRGTYLPGEIEAKNLGLQEAKRDYLINAEKTRVPEGRSTADYTKVLQAQAVAKAADQGKVDVTVVDGAAMAAVVKGK